MTAVHARSELLEPLLLAHSFSHVHFRDARLTRCRREALKKIVREHLLDDTAIAEGLELVEERAADDLEREDPLHKAIREDAARWLVLEGDHWSLRVDSHKPGREIVRWRGLTMFLPPSLVIAGALASQGILCPRRVQSLPATVAPQEPIGHLHVHLGPMLPFEALWTHLWIAFLQRRSLDARHGKEGIDAINARVLPEIAPAGTSKQRGLGWQWLLELAFIARAWLERCLEYPRGDHPPSRALRCFAQGEVDISDRRRTLLVLWSSEAMLPNSRAREAAFARWANRKVESTLRDRENHLRDESLAWGPTATKKPRVKPKPMPECDEEVGFMARALTQCEREHLPENVGVFARIFYQYLRVKVALYGTLVVDPWACGLRHFLDVVARDKPYTDVAADDKALSGARLSAARNERPLDLGPLEVHTLPSSWLKQQPRDDRAGSHRWILSFVRSPKSEKEDSDGINGSSKWRKHTEDQGSVFRQIRRRLEERPALLKTLRGVGLMDWERNGPVWLFEPHLRRLIDASRQIAAEHHGLSPLRTAFHLGEDFDHVLSGLRQIYEPFAWELIGRGDRIGHALALGLRPEQWAAKHSRVRVRPWDRILDIGFVAWASSDRGLRIDAEEINRLRASAAECFAMVFNDCPGEPLEVARHVWLELPVTRRPRASRTLRSLAVWAYDRIAELHDDRAIGRRALSPSLIVDAGLDLPVIKAVHGFVHRQIAEMQVAIEINPSSNLLVGGFRSIFEQPIFHFADLPIVINADDPLTFATTLADDYAYAWAGMVLAQPRTITPAEATHRLEEAARNSIRYAFHDDWRVVSHEEKSTSALEHVAARRRAT